MEDIPACACQRPGGTFRQYFASGELDFARCDQCGLVMRCPMPTWGTLDRIYRELYGAGQIEAGTTHQESGAYALQRYERYLTKNWLRAGDRVLDYGAGTGEFVALLRGRGIDTVGVERAESARRYCHEKRDINLKCDLSDVPASSLDCVTMIEVIEHLPDPRSALLELRPKLRAGGLLFVTTPNLKGLRARLDGGRWREAVKKFHVVLFDEVALCDLLRAVGYAHVFRIRYSPVQRSGLTARLSTRIQQTLGLGGSLCVVARAPESPTGAGTPADRA